MFSRNDPRLRRTLNQLSQNIESANESAQAGLFDFERRYLAPCLASTSECLGACTEPCFGTREEQLRRQRRRTRGRAEQSFDFYDDMDDDEGGALLGWNNHDELDRLLAGSGAHARRKRLQDQQPGRQRTMSYGTRGDTRPRRKSAVQVPDTGVDPTVIPQSSFLGFLERFGVRNKGLKYQPSANDLRENPGGIVSQSEEAEPLIDNDSDDDTNAARTAARHKRHRSETATSGHTTDSLSSRGDIFPSEDELDDAQLMDDEFTIGLERRVTNLDSTEASSGKSRAGRRSSGSQRSAQSAASRNSRGELRRVPTEDAIDEEAMVEPMTFAELKQEDEQAQVQEEAEVERKRDAARRLALRRGFSSTDEMSSAEIKSETLSEHTPESDSVQSPAPIAGDESFPLFESHIDPDHLTSSVDASSPSPNRSGVHTPSGAFVPAQLPNFGRKPD